MPGWPGLPGWLEPPGLPEWPELLGWLGLPGSPELPGLLGLLGLPGWPGLLGLPGWPGLLGWRRVRLWLGRLRLGRPGTGTCPWWLSPT
jgi:hypothetical protein